jgi:hypothetical protein
MNDNKNYATVAVGERVYCYKYLIPLKKTEPLATA